MGLSKSTNKTHNDTMADAESTRQSVIGVAGVTQATVRSADIAFYRSAVTSGLANGVDVGGYIGALRNLGATI